MYELKLLTVKEILQQSAELLTALDRALTHCLVPGWTAVDVLQESIASPRDFHLWAITMEGMPVAYGSTRAFTYPQQTTLSITTLANVNGDPVSNEEYIFLLEELENQATKRGFDKIEVVGRFGWKKRLTPLGYQVDTVTFSKTLGD